jgi:hypothetical protein
MTFCHGAFEKRPRLLKNFRKTGRINAYVHFFAKHMHDIPIYIFINFDQTQVIYVPGNRMTWSQTGAKQVGMVGMDEKRVFTLVVGVAADGSLLPFQAVFVGKTKASVPSA